MGNKNSKRIDNNFSNLSVVSPDCRHFLLNPRIIDCRSESGENEGGASPVKILCLILLISYLFERSDGRTNISDLRHECYFASFFGCSVRQRMPHDLRGQLHLFGYMLM